MNEKDLGNEDFNNDKYRKRLLPAISTFNMIITPKTVNSPHRNITMGESL
jgi:hypothetical protein